MKGKSYGPTVDLLPPNRSPRINTINCVFFRDGQPWFRRLRLVLGKPAVVLEAEGFWRGAVTDVDVDLNLGAAEGDLVAFDENIAARPESGAFGFLKNSEYPFFRKQNGVVGELSSFDTHKSCSTQAALNEVVGHHDAAGFLHGPLWTEKGQTRGAADIDGTLPRVCEMAFFDHDIAGAAFELDASTGGEAFFADETAAGDERVMTADEVDGLAAPAGDRAIADRQFVETGALDAVMIALGADVADLDMFNGAAGGGIGQITAIVEIEAVARLPADPQIPQREVVAAREMPRVGSASEVRWVFRIQRCNGELFDAADMMTAGIVAWSDFERGVGFETAQSGA